MPTKPKKEQKFLDPRWRWNQLPDRVNNSDLNDSAKLVYAERWTWSKRHKYQPVTATSYYLSNTKYPDQCLGLSRRTIDAAFEELRKSNWMRPAKGTKGEILTDGNKKPKQYTNSDDWIAVPRSTTPEIQPLIGTQNYAADLITFSWLMRMTNFGADFGLGGALKIVLNKRYPCANPEKPQYRGGRYAADKRKVLKRSFDRLQNAGLIWQSQPYEGEHCECDGTEVWVRPMVEFTSKRVQALLDHQEFIEEPGHLWWYLQFKKAHCVSLGPMAEQAESVATEGKDANPPACYVIPA